MVKAAQNPQAVIDQLSQNNPKVQQVLQYIQQNGGDAKAVFYTLAKQKGVDPNQVIQQAQGIIKYYFKG